MLQMRTPSPRQSHLIKSKTLLSGFRASGKLPSVACPVVDPESACGSKGPPFTWKSGVPCLLLDVDPSPLVTIGSQRVTVAGQVLVIARHRSRELGRRGNVLVLYQCAAELGRRNAI